MNFLFNDPKLQNRISDIEKAIEVVSADKSLKSPGEQLSAAMKILDPKGQPQREAAAEAAKAEFQAQLNKKGGRRTQKRPTARRRLRRGSSKARKARTTRRK